MRWHITIIMMEKRVVPRHTEGLAETNVYIKASLNGRRQGAEQMSLPRRAFPQRPSRQRSCGWLSISSGQDLLPQCSQPGALMLTTGYKTGFLFFFFFFICSLAIKGEFTHFQVSKMCAHNCQLGAFPAEGSADNTL